MTTDVVAHVAETWLGELLTEVGSIRTTGRHGKFQCPAHARSGEHAPSLALGTRDDRRGAWLVCFAGCSTREVLASLGLGLDALRRPPQVSAEAFARCRRLERAFPAPRQGDGSPRQLGFRFEAFENYGPDHRQERLRHPVTGAKSLRWESRNPHGEWVPGLLGTPESSLPLYRPHEVAAAVALGEPVIVVESASSADALRTWTCTTWAGGCGSPRIGPLRASLAEHHQTLYIGDADEPGKRCSQRIAAALPLARVVESRRQGEDARDLWTRLGADAFSVEIGAVLHGGHPTYTREVPR